ncbi:secreted protein [Streptomyces viridochromogenes DSM 40736]|uniref:Secreted protein n=1 Tax=Streptomyces viridochromogenes (strain DSM 40736 / JCM 4977 / BCRC 1201 / Tue 494) TaxID=591159 RepID=D9WYB8_STRVT|nr:hypothetical protein [Streptomyces viridochromogenes]EFL31012.1 secreted protein [Streptomyces viridochromogenes DSM 40736]
MQPSAVPELAHTHTRPIHWLATATAVAGVVAFSSFLQPDAATAAQAASPRTKSAPAHFAPPDPAAATFPIECGPVQAVVKKKASGDLDGDGSPETVAVVHCDSPMGTPPDGVYVLTRDGDTGKPRVVATLLDPRKRTNVSDFAVRDGAVRATLLGYSSADVPRCCPDVKSDVKWRWQDGAFVRSTPSGARSV